MREDIEVLRELIDEGDSSSIEKALQRLEYSMRASEIILIERSRELAEVRERYRTLKTEWDRLEAECSAVRNWFARKGIAFPAPGITQDKSVPAGAGAERTA